jgi:MerR family transcriptional regulator, Zn(II)-responsive regulator of zntA
MTKTNQFFQVKELADLCRVSTDVVRHYTRIGLLNPGRDPGNGYKLYTENDVARLNFIRRAKLLGYTLKEIAQIISDSEKGESACPRVRKIIQHRIEDIRAQQEEAYQLLNRMELAVNEWEQMPDGIPDGKVICQLIDFSMTDMRAVG